MVRRVGVTSLRQIGDDFWSGDLRSAKEKVTSFSRLGSTVLERRATELDRLLIAASLLENSLGEGGRGGSNRENERESRGL